MLHLAVASVASKKMLWGLSASAAAPHSNAEPFCNTWQGLPCHMQHLQIATSVQKLCYRIGHILAGPILKQKCQLANAEHDSASGAENACMISQRLCKLSHPAFSGNAEACEKLQCPSNGSKTLADAEQLS